MKVTTMTSLVGNPMPYQVIVNDNNVTWFTSYGRNIVKISPDGVATILTYRSMFSL